MKFIRKMADPSPIEDTVFKVAKAAKEDIQKHGFEKVIDATIGTLYDEDRNLVAFNSVYDFFQNLDKKTIATYADSFVGNTSYHDAVQTWVFKDVALNLNSRVIATSGGTGAISLSLTNLMDNNDTIIIPEIGWGSYKLMAQQFNLNVKTYSLFQEEQFDLKNFKEVCLAVLQQQKKLFIIINDPCHNPTGFSFDQKTWQAIIEFINECSKIGPCILLNDIAYIDFSYQKAPNRYMQHFDQISDNVLIIVAFSTSKSLTSYGLRCGAAILLTQKKETIDEVYIQFEKGARSLWNNINNAAMETFCYIANQGYQNYIKEKAHYVQLLKDRSSLFLQEAKQCQLQHYPYHEGFFITLIVDENHKKSIHQAFMDHHIYTVMVNKGIRIAICSLPMHKIKGLAYKLKQILDSIK